MLKDSTSEKQQEETDLQRKLETGCVMVLYHPSEETVQNIDLILPWVSRMVLVCNSPRQDFPAKLQDLSSEKISYVEQNENVGIARALNDGIARLDAENLKWALTMDQDSHPQEDMIPRLYRGVRELANDQIAIYTPWHQFVLNRPPENTDYQETLRSMTSGNLLRISAWRDVGGFLDDLFIDAVDHEFYLRLAKNGYKCVQVNRAVLKHQLGNMREHRFILFHSPRPVSHHNPVRRYYISRNRLWTAFKYRKQERNFFFQELRYFGADFFNILMFEEQKLAKLKMVFLGSFDFLRGRLGKRF